MRDPSNILFSLAADFIQHTSRSVFLTGKAGTGKTTFLRYIANNSGKNIAVAAPTGVAAINAGGMTLHSLFQLPFGIYLPNYSRHHEFLQITNRNTLFKNLRLSQPKRELLQELELLIIDEVSMVRCDMLDAVDTILRTIRRNQKPFGGVQVLFIGDLYQLSPVAKSDEWALLQNEYESPFFFHSHVIRETQPLCIELNKIYRQNEQTFIDLLNAIRNNNAKESDLTLLNSRLNQRAPTGAVTLTTHNQKADVINTTQLSNLGGKKFQFTAIIENDFPSNNYPVEEIITLKRGARVMFIKNDSSEEKRYYNGKMATVTHVDEDAIEVEFDEGTTYDLTREVWHNIRYHYDREKDHIEEEVLGSFTQYPIRLAWAITIHKSQGLTFTNAIIDAGSSFAAGQVYVALSRCTSLEGLVLQSPITSRQIMTDPQVVAYSKQLHKENILADLLEQEKRVYEKDKLTRLFDFYKLKDVLTEWAAGVPEKKLPDIESAVQLSRNLLAKADELIELGEKTKQWMERNFVKAEENASDEVLLAGLKKSVGHFNKLLHDDFFMKLQEHLATLKGKSKVKKYTQEVIAVAQAFIVVGKRIRSAQWNGNILAEGNEPEFIEVITAKSLADTPKVNSAWESKVLFDSGSSIEGIASARGLAVSTIEGHIAQYVKSGDIALNKVVDETKVSAIIDALQASEETGFKPVKEKLGDEYSYGEIRMVFNHLEFLKNK